MKTTLKPGEVTLAVVQDLIRRKRLYHFQVTQRDGVDDETTYDLLLEAASQKGAEKRADHYVKHWWPDVEPDAISYESTHTIFDVGDHCHEAWLSGFVLPVTSVDDILNMPLVAK